MGTLRGPELRQLTRQPVKSPSNINAAQLQRRAAFPACQKLRACLFGADSSPSAPFSWCKHRKRVGAALPFFPLVNTSKPLFKWCKLDPAASTQWTHLSPNRVHIRRGTPVHYPHVICSICSICSVRMRSMRITQKYVIRMWCDSLPTNLTRVGVIVFWYQSLVLESIPEAQMHTHPSHTQHGNAHTLKEVTWHYRIIYAAVTICFKYRVTHLHPTFLTFHVQFKES